MWGSNPCDGRDGEVVMTEVDSVGDAEGLGFGIDDMIAAVMLQVGAALEFFPARYPKNSY